MQKDDVMKYVLKDEILEDERMDGSEKISIVVIAN
jgi:hypothetical protein